MLVLSIVVEEVEVDIIEALDEGNCAAVVVGLAADDIALVDVF